MSINVIRCVNILNSKHETRNKFSMIQVRRPRKDQGGVDNGVSPLTPPSLIRGCVVIASEGERGIIGLSDFDIGIPDFSCGVLT